MTATDRLRMRGRPVEEKLRLNHVVDPASGCWRWTRSHDVDGYGLLWADGRTRKVHRIAYELWIGPIPEGLTIDHVLARGCVHRDCLNPEHLEAVTVAENIRRRRTTTITHCKNGHELTPENTAPSGTERRCRTCHNEAAMRHYYARRGEGSNTSRQPVTHCIRGHEFTPENTYRRSNGRRSCRECMRLYGAERRARRRAQRSQPT